MREALIEREVLLNAAPHIIWPMRFVLPHSPDGPAGLAGAARAVPLRPSRRAQEAARHAHARSAAATRKARRCSTSYTKGFEYSDCWVDDARLVVLNALDAAERGAEVLTRTPLLRRAPRRTAAGRSQLRERRVPARPRTFRARCLVNAAGPWVNGRHRPRRRLELQPQRAPGQGQPHHRAEVLDGRQAYLVQNHDKRVIFINPYEGDLALIGTTDIAYEGRAEDVKADESEIDYLLAAVNRYFKEKLRRQDVRPQLLRGRPLFDDGKGNPSAVTRDYVFDLDETGGAPLLTVFGGKITTFRELAERGLQRLKHSSSRRCAAIGPRPRRCPAATCPMPISKASSKACARPIRGCRADWSTITPGSTARAPATSSATASGLAELGRHYGGLLYEAEVRYLVANEWAQTPEDILMRRTKQDLHISDAEKAAFVAWFEAQHFADAA